MSRGGGTNTNTFEGDVTWAQIVSGGVLVAMLLGLAIGYGWRQVAVLCGTDDRPEAERRFQRRLARRRLLSSLLLLVMAGLLAALMLFWEAPAQQLADERDAQEARGEVLPLTPDQRAFARSWALLWIVFLIVLLAVVLLALLDVWAIRVYARTQFQKIRDDRRAMVERQAARLRRERKGPPDVSLN